MAAPTYFDKGSPVGAQGSPTMNWPSGHQADDIGIGFTETANQEYTPPAGWGTILSVGLGTPGAVNATRATLLWKRATSGAEPGLTVPDVGDHVGGRILVVRGCVLTGNPFQDFDTDTLGTPSTSVSIPGGVTSLSDCLLLLGFTVPTDNANPPITSAPTNPGLTILNGTATGFIAGNGGGWWLGTAEKLVAGSFPATSATLVTGAAEQAKFWVAFKSPDSVGLIGGPPIRPHIFMAQEAAVHRASRW